MTIGVLEATTDALGEAINKIAGFRFTRLAASVAEGATTLTVETTYGWPTSGTCVLHGTLHKYTGKTATTFTGVTWDDAGNTVVGARADYAVGSTVLDYSRTFSALDALRSQLIVDTATGEALSIIGRNHGVERPSSLPDDDAFRAIIKALAYLPKGTRQGLELALTAFFGAGNFEITERLRGVKVSSTGEAERTFQVAGAYPNTVFIRLLDGSQLSASGEGRGYFTFSEAKPLNTGTRAVAYTALPSCVQGVRLEDENRTDTLTTTRPSALVEIRYDGDAGDFVWKYAGTAVENAAMTMDTNKGLTISPTAGFTAAYYRTARIRPESKASFTLTARQAVVNSSSGTSGKQFFMAIRTGARDVAVGVIGDGFTGHNLGFINTTTGAFIGTPVTDVGGVQWRDITILLDGADVALCVDGNVVLRAAASDFPATVLNEFRFGCENTVSTTVLVKTISTYATTETDYWNSTGSTGSVNSGDIDRLDTNSGAMITSDAGKSIRTESSTIPSNNGVWKVTARIDADNLDLEGVWRTLAFVSSATPNRITTVSPDVFTYPDDVGKLLELDASTAPNPGTYLIVAILDETGADITGSRTQYSNKVRVTPPGGGFVAEVAIPWRLNPNFQTDAAITWTLAASGAVTPPNLILRANPPLNIPVGYVVIMRATYATAPSAHLLASQDIHNEEVAGPTWSEWPLYLPANMLGPYSVYLDDLTVAGVIPEVIL